MQATGADDPAFIHWMLKWPDRFILGLRGEGDKIGRGRSRPSAGRKLSARTDRKRRLGISETAAGSRLFPSELPGSEIILIDDSWRGWGLDVSSPPFFTDHGKPGFHVF